MSKKKGYYRANNSCFSSGVRTMCSGTNWNNDGTQLPTNPLELKIIKQY